MALLTALGAVLLLLGIIRWQIGPRWAKRLTRYHKTANKLGITGLQAAHQLRASLDLQLRIEEVPGYADDAYSSSEGLLKLSNHTLTKATVDALGFTAHEIGHAVQQVRGRGNFRFLPAIDILRCIAWWLGIVLSGLGLLGVDLWIIVGLISLGVVTAIDTLSILRELEASDIGMRLLRYHHLTSPNELAQIKDLLATAGFSYVLRFIIDIAFILIGAGAWIMF